MSLWQFIWYIQWNLKTLRFDNTIIWNRGHSAVALLVMFYIKIPLRDTRFLKVEQYSLYVFLLVYVSNWLIVQWRYDIHLKGSRCSLLCSVASLRSQDNLLEFLFLQRQLALIRTHSHISERPSAFIDMPVAGQAIALMTKRHQSGRL